MITADGEKHIRKSPRVYTHAVVITERDGSLLKDIRTCENEIEMNNKYIAKYSVTNPEYVSNYEESTVRQKAKIENLNAMINKGFTKHFVHGWSQSAANAVKMAEQARRYYSAGDTTIEIVEVTRA